MKKYNWGIIGPGTIARTFMKAVRVVKSCQVTAVVNKPEHMKNANRFAEEFGIKKCYDSYEALAADPEIDIVYVSTVNSLHKEAVLTCLKAGKHVLCEKPLGLCAADVREMIECASQNDCFLLEGVWTLFLPVIRKLKQEISKGKIGEVKLVRSEFCFPGVNMGEGRLVSLDKGGGALTDVGIYSIALSNLIFGQAPVSYSGDAYLGKSGVDEHCAVLLKYKNGGMGTFCSAIDCWSRNEAVIAGTHGTIRMPSFWTADRLYIEQRIEDDVTQEVIECPIEASGLEYEIRETLACVGRGDKYSRVYPPEKTLANAAVLENLRHGWGEYFTGEQR